MYISRFFMSLVILVLVGCGSESDDEHTEALAINNPMVVGISYDESSIEESKNYDDVEQLRNRYAKGDLLAGYFLAIALIQGYNIEKNQKKGASLLEETWSKGLVDSGFSLYTLYYHGIGVDENKDKALSYLKRSAELGYMPSQRKLGMLYYDNDDFLEANPELAFKWLLKAAENGDKLSALNVAGMYRQGHGVKKDAKQAFEWLSKIKDKKYGGKTIGFAALGHYYEDGIGTEKNLVLAYKYYDLLRPGMDEDKARVASKMSKEQIQEGKKLSREWQNSNNIHVIE